MAGRNTDHGDFSNVDPWEDLDFYMRQIPIKRLKAAEGLPIVTSEQLHTVNAGLDEVMYYTTEYDSFSPGLGELDAPAVAEPDPDRPRRPHPRRRRRRS